MKAAMWARVSTGSQSEENQVPEIEAFALHHCHTITERYELADSAWNGGKDGGEYRAALQRALDDAWAGKFSMLIVWSLDRITRESAEGMLRLIRQFRERGCIVVSVKESWLNTSPEVQDVMVALAGWQAQQESRRRSERVRAGIERRRQEGTWVGRGKDADERKKAGYFAREARKRANR